MLEKVEYVPTDKKVFLFLGRFQPFHNGHLSAVKFVHSKLKVPAVLCQIRSKSDKSPFPKHLMDEMMKAVISSESMIEQFIEFDKGLIPAIIKQLQNKYKYDVVGIGAGADRMKDYTRQADYMHSDKSDVGITDNFSIVETPRSMSGTAVRNMIIQDKEADFKKAVPKYLHKYYDQFKKVLSVNESTVGRKYIMEYSLFRLQEMD